MPGHHDALKRELRAARSQAGYESDQALAIAASVHLQTLQNWMSGKTTPRPSELSKVARTLGKPLDHFMAAYEGRDPEPQPLQDVVRDLVVKVEALVTEMQTDRERGQDAAAAMLRAAKVLGARPTPGAAPASNGRPAPRETTGSE